MLNSAAMNTTALQTTDSMAEERLRVRAGGELAYALSYATASTNGMDPLREVGETLPMVKPRTGMPVYVPEVQWEGQVLEVYEDSFLARLVDMSGKNPDEEAEITFDAVQDDDRTLLRPGAIFYWQIGYRQEGGTRCSVSMLLFRRMPRWTKFELEAIRTEGNELFERFNCRTPE